MLKPCKYVSVWDGYIKIESDAKYDPDTGIVSDVEMAALQDSILESLDILTREYVIIDGKQYDLVNNDDDTYSVVRRYEVFFARTGYAVVEATSKDDAFRIADRELKLDDVSWDEDWHPTDIQIEGSGSEDYFDLVEYPDEGTIAFAGRGTVRVDIEYIGEGWYGDYDPDNKDDEPLLRFSIYKDNAQVDDASYCTSVRADIPVEHASQLAERILNEVYEPLMSGHSIKKLCESLSWIS